MQTFDHWRTIIEFSCIKYEYDCGIFHTFKFLQQLLMHTKQHAVAVVTMIAYKGLCQAL